MTLTYMSENALLPRVTKINESYSVQKDNITVQTVTVCRKIT